MIKYKSMYLALIEITATDVSKDFFTDVESPFNVTHLKDSIFESDDSNDCMIIEPLAKKPKKSSDVNRGPRSAMAVFKYLTNGIEITSRAKTFSFYSRIKQPERDLLIVHFIPKMKNMFEVIKMIMMIHFNGMDLTSTFSPVPNIWPNPSDKELKRLEKVSNDDDYLNFYACVYL